MTEKKIVDFELDPALFPFRVRFLRGDTREQVGDVLVVTGPGVVDVPGFGDLGVPILTETTWGDGTVDLLGPNGPAVP